MNLKTFTALARLTAQFYQEPVPMVKELEPGKFCCFLDHYQLTIETTGSEITATLVRPGRRTVGAAESINGVSELRCYLYWIEFAVTSPQHQ